MTIEGANRPDDSEVAERLTNRYLGIGTRAAKSDLRIVMMNMNWDTGLRITCSDDLVGLPTVGEDSPDF